MNLKFAHLCLSLFLFLKITNCAFAQRGQTTHNTTESPKSPMNGLPGYFNSELAPENRFIIDIPLVGLDYGYSKNLTIGTNLPILSSTIFVLKPNVFGKVRYRLISNETFNTAVTGYFGFSGNTLDANNSTFLFNGTTNTTFYYEKFYINFHTTALFVNSQSFHTKHSKYSNAQFYLFAFGPGIHYFFNEKHSIESHFIYSPFYKLNVEDIKLLRKFSFPNYGILTPTFLYNYKTGTESVLSIGVIAVATELILPLFNWKIII